MSIILVEIKTDHSDNDEAIKSVTNAMKRAGYDFTEYDTGSFAVFMETKQSEGVIYYSHLSNGRGYIQVREPEVNRD